MLSSKFNQRSIAMYKKAPSNENNWLAYLLLLRITKNVTGIREIKPMQRNLNSVAVEWITCNYYV